MKVSKPEDAALSRLQFHHSSFHDFLLNSNRSGRFTISERGEIMDIVRPGIYWYEVDAIHFHSHDGKHAFKILCFFFLENCAYSIQGGL